ncbi:MAG TPA: hypothetical protein VGG99_10215 [Acetobacteraceae bacterium]|jgi:hypothetical protein
MDQTEPAREGNAAYMKTQRDIYYQAVHSLYGTLPTPPREHRDNSERRYRVAIAHVASLAPVNADETNLAVNCVVASAQAEECLRCVVEETEDLATIARLQRQAASMMRESRGSRSMLLRVQAVRQKREADETARGQGEWAEHCAFGMMTDALEDRLQAWAFALRRPAALAAEKARAVLEPAPAAAAAGPQPAAGATVPQAAAPEQDNVAKAVSVARVAIDADRDTDADADMDTEKDSAGADTDIDTDDCTGTNADDDYDGDDTDADDDADLDLAVANAPPAAEMLQLLERLPTPNGFDPQVLAKLECIVNGKRHKPVTG